MSDPATPPFIWIEKATERSARVVYQEPVLTVMRSLLYGTKHPGHEGVRTLRRLTIALWDGQRRVHSTHVTQRSAQSIARFLDVIAYEVSYLHRAMQPWVSEADRFAFDRALKDTSAFLVRFAQGRVDAVELIGRIAPK